jgi:hypothetical protein
MEAATEAFVAHRNLLFTVAYEMLGSAADQVAAALGRIAAVASLHAAHVNGYPALVIRIDGQVDTVVAVRMEGGLVTGLYAVRNPEKLSHLRRAAALQR